MAADHDESYAARMADQTATDTTPPYVVTEEDHKRWALANARAAEALGLPADSEQVWSAARVLFHSDIPTE